MGYHALLQGIFPTQGLNLRLLHLSYISYIGMRVGSFISGTWAAHKCGIAFYKLWIAMLYTSKVLYINCTSMFQKKNDSKDENKSREQNQRSEDGAKNPKYRAENHPLLPSLEALIKELCLEFTWLDF